MGERAKTQTSTKNICGTVNLLNSTLRVPVGQSGWEWCHSSPFVLGYVISSKKSSICEVLFSTYSFKEDGKFQKNIKFKKCLSKSCKKEKSTLFRSRSLKTGGILVEGLFSVNNATIL